MTIFCTADAWACLHEIATRAYPREAVALLGGTPLSGGFRVRAVESRSATTSDHGFSITPETVLRSEARFRRAGLALCGVFHSHPDGSAILSDADRRGAFSEHLQLVGRIAPGEPLSATAWVRASGIWRRVPFARATGTEEPVS